MKTGALILAIISICFYCIAAALYLLKAIKKDDRFQGIASLCIIIGFFAQGFMIAALTLAYGNGFWISSNIIALVSWLIAFAYCMFEVLAKNRCWGQYVLPIVAIIMAVALVI